MTFTYIQIHAYVHAHTCAHVHARMRTHRAAAEDEILKVDERLKTRGWLVDADSFLEHRLHSDQSEEFKLRHCVRLFY